MSAVAAARRERNRPTVHGLVLLNKPAGLSSNAALQRVKRLFGVKKAGHTGSLDPAATGMLPLCFGEATKASGFLLDADKTYRVVARLGEATDTGDAEGKVVARADLPSMTAGDWDKVLQGFRGDIEQVPPMYSALKKDGKRLYELARKGETVERKPRPVTIHDIVLTELAGRRLVFRVRCSKGTYIRTLVEDFAAAAGTVAYTANLHRESVSGFEAGEMMELAALEQLADSGREALEERLLPVDRALKGYEAVELDLAEAGRFRNGQRLVVSALCTGLVRVYGPNGEFLGLAELEASGRLSPRRIFHLGGAVSGEKC